MARFVIKKAGNGWQYYFNLIAPNGQVIATSEMYNSKMAAQQGVQSVKLYAPTARVDDVTGSAGRF